MVSHDEVPSHEEAEKSANIAASDDVGAEEHDGPEDDVSFKALLYIAYHPACLCGY